MELQNLAEDQDVVFEIELVSFEKTPHWHSMTAVDKIDRAEQVREQGNKAFRLGRLEMAKQKYMKAMKLLDNAYDADTQEQVFQPGFWIPELLLKAFLESNVAKNPLIRSPALNLSRLCLLVEKSLYTVQRTMRTSKLLH